VTPPVPFRASPCNYPLHGVWRDVPLLLPKWGNFLLMVPVVSPFLCLPRSEYFVCAVQGSRNRFRFNPPHSVFFLISLSVYIPNFVCLPSQYFLTASKTGGADDLVQSPPNVPLKLEPISPSDARVSIIFPLLIRFFLILRYPCLCKFPDSTFPFFLAA